MRKTAKKTTKKTAEVQGFSRGIFYAMAFLCLASVLTACVTLGGYFNKDDNDRVRSNLDNSGDVVEVEPAKVNDGYDGNITLINPMPPEEKAEADKGELLVGEAIEEQIGRAIQEAIAKHKEELHTYSPHYTLLKCHQLGTNTFSCKIVQGENIPLPEKKDVPIVELTPKQEEKYHEDEPEVKEEKKSKSSWNPFN